MCLVGVNWGFYCGQRRDCWFLDSNNILEIPSVFAGIMVPADRFHCTVFSMQVAV
jgi:hypothetical protein